MFVLQLRNVSIHAPREGCDLIRKGFLTAYSVFQFTHPGRGATTILNAHLITL